MKLNLKELNTHLKAVRTDFKPVFDIVSAIFDTDGGYALTTLEKYLMRYPKESNLIDVLPRWDDFRVEYGEMLFFLTAALNKMIPGDRDEAVIDGDYTVKETTIIEGDLIVKGDLKIESMDDQHVLLIVLGDLHISGNYPVNWEVLLVAGDCTIDGAIDEPGEWSLTAIGGYLSVKKYISSAGDLLVNGMVESPFIYCHYNNGKAIFRGGFSTLYLRETDHGGSVAAGNQRGDYILVDEMIGVKERKDIENIFKLIKPELIRAVEAQYFKTRDDFDPDGFTDFLLEHLQGGASIFKDEVLLNWKRFY